MFYWWWMVAEFGIVRQNEILDRVPGLKQPVLKHL